MLKRIFLFALLFLTALSFGLNRHPASAASYDYYVKDGSSGDGSESDPFGSITDALDEAKEHGGKKIYIHKGSYGESFTLSKGVELVGADTKGVVITGSVRMEDKSRVSQLTVVSGGILTAGKADVTISKVRVKNVLKVAIKGEEGNGTITVRDTVVENSGKGFYLQRGNEIRAENIEVENNTQEGMDIRENVSGVIEKSTFQNNGESGIEVVLGSSDLIIRSNSFSDNGASGVAAQFFHGAKKVGDVKIENNSMNSNKNYGIDCKSPLGGPESKDYFLNSISAVGNTFSKNKAGDISNRCRVLTDEERVALAAKPVATLDETLSPEESAERVQRDAGARRAYHEEREKIERERIEPALGKVVELKNRLEEDENRIFGRNKVVCTLIGEDAFSRKSLFYTIDRLGATLEEIRRQGTTLDYESNKRLVDETLEEFDATVSTIHDESDKQICSFSLFGWLSTFIAEKRSPKLLVPEDEFKTLSLLPVSKERSILFLGSIQYGPKNRMQIIKNGDEFPFVAVKDVFRSYDIVTATLDSPILDEADPAPYQNSLALLPLPARFANVFSEHNLRLFHIGNSPLFARNGEQGYVKNKAYTAFAQTETFGGGETVKTVFLEGLPITFVSYTESKTTTLDSVRTTIEEAKKTAFAVIVYIAYSQSTGTTLTEARKQEARALIDAGATMVIGTGLPLAPLSEPVGAGKVYYSLGNFWSGNTLPPSGESGLAVTLKLDPSGQPTWSEHVVSRDSEGKILLTTKE